MRALVTLVGSIAAVGCTISVCALPFLIRAAIAIASTKATADASRGAPEPEGSHSGAQPLQSGALGVPAAIAAKCAVGYYWVEREHDLQPMLATQSVSGHTGSKTLAVEEASAAAETGAAVADQRLQCDVHRTWLSAADWNVATRETTPSEVTPVAGTDAPATASPSVAHLGISPTAKKATDEVVETGKRVPHSERNGSAGAPTSSSARSPTAVVPFLLFKDNALQRASHCPVADGDAVPQRQDSTHRIARST